MSKKIISVFLVISVLLLISFPCGAVSVGARSTVLMIAGSNEIVYADNSDERLPMASNVLPMAPA